MWGFYGAKRIAMALDSAASKSTWIDVRGANFVSLELPAFATLFAAATANVYGEGAQAITDTAYRVVTEGKYSGTSGLYQWELPSCTGTVTTPLPWATNFNFIKIHFSTAATDGYTGYIHLKQ
jgi:hypothetical protein